MTPEADPLDTVAEGLDSAQREVNGERERRRRMERVYQRSVIAAALVAVAVSVGSVVIALPVYVRLQDVEAVEAANTEREAQLRQRAEAATRAGAEANAQLTARGLAPVSIPDPATAPPAAVLVAAGTARVLADLALAGVGNPTPQQLGDGVAEYLRSTPVTPVGPTAGQLAESLAGHLATTTPQVDGWPRNPPPTPQQIEQVFRETVARNPDILCPRGGMFVRVDGVTSATGTYSHWTCLTDAAPPPARPTT